MTSGSTGGKLFFFLSWVLAPCLADRGGSGCLSAERTSDGRKEGEGRTERIRLDGQVAEGKYLQCHFGRRSSPPSPPLPHSPWHTSYSEKSGHVSIRLSTPTPHSVFRGTDLISGIIFQTGHRWEIKLKTWPCMGHKG